MAPPTAYDVLGLWLSTAAAALFAASDVFQAYEPAFPMDIALTSAAAFQAMSAGVTMAHGCATVPGFKAFMPFQGGSRFVTMQATGYTAVAAAIGMPAFFRGAVQPHFMPHSVHGPLIACAVVAWIGAWLLRQSLDTFVHQATSAHPRLKADAGEAVLVGMLALLSAGFAVIADVVHGVSRPAVVAALFLHVACGFLNHVVVGWIQTPGYHLFAPFAGTFKAFVARAAAWILWSIAAFAGITLLLADAPFQRSYSVFGTVAMVSNFAILAGIRGGAATETRKTSSKSALARDGRAVLTVVSSACFVGVAGCAAVYEEEWRYSIVTANWIFIAAMFFVPPLSQVTGRMLHGDAFDMWHPFNRGSGRFLAFHSIGWGTYTTAAVVATIEAQRDTAVATAGLLLLAQIAVHTSIRIFVSRKPVAPGTAVSKSTAADGLVLRNELLVASALAVFSVILCVVSDIIRDRHDFPLPSVLAASSAMWAVAVPLAHFARSDRARALFRPFDGTVEYVALQAVGWSFYTLCLIVAIVLQVELASNLPAVLGRTSGYSYAFTVQGLLKQIPFGLIAASAFFDSAATPESKAAAVLRAATDLDPEGQRALAESIIRASKLAPSDVSSVVAGLAAAARGQRSDVNQRQSGVASIIVGCLGAACMVFALAADSSKSRSPVLALVLAFLCIFVSGGTATCVHCGYGPSVYPGVYKRWMPFRGGVSFVTWQVCGGSSFSVGTIMFIFSLASLFGDGGAVENVSGIAAAGVFLAVAPIFALVSVRHFDPEVARATERVPTAFERHAEGIVSVLVFALAWTATSAYDMASGSENWVLVAPPLLIGTLCTAVALPLGFIALHKSYVTWLKERQEETVDDDLGESFAGQPSTRSGFPLLEVVSVCVLGSVPVLGAAVMHYAYHQLGDGLETAVSVASHTIGLGTVLVAVSVATSVKMSMMPRVVVDFVAAAITLALYSALFLQGVVIVVAWNTDLRCRWLVMANVVLLMAPRPLRISTNLVNVAFVGLSLAESLLGRLPWRGTVIDAVVMAFWIWYHTTYNGVSEHTGTRYSPRVIAWCRRWWLWGLERYFSVNVVYEGSHPICGRTSDGSIPQQAVLGFHPHGVFPLTAVWMLSLEQWIAAVGAARRVSVHAASILFSLPLVRDIGMSFGGCTVTREAIELALHDGRCPLIVPGGQAEMLETAFSKSKLTLVGYHKGFVRLAVKHRVQLVPVFCFGEHNVMDNIHLPDIQRFFLNRFGFGFPVCPWGRWFLPLPVKTPLTIAVGEALDPMSIAPELATAAHGTAAWEAGIDAVTRAYFESMLAMIERRKEEAGYPDLVVHVAYENPRKKKGPPSSAAPVAAPRGASNNKPLTPADQRPSQGNDRAAPAKESAPAKPPTSKKKKKARQGQ